MYISSERKGLWGLLVLSILVTLPFLGITDFHTKGEPREAIVAYSMLDSDNWILPTNNGGEMAYKPPFFHWCIATFSILLGGEVNEYTSRLPSTIAAIAMLISCYLYFVRRGAKQAFLTCILLLTCFEVHRAIFACRVDMVLTACIVGALLCLARWAETLPRSFPWWAVLWMSLGTLTKGPIAILLPCGVAGLFLLMQGEGFWRSVGRMALIACSSLLIPCCWYYAAYLQGGDEFLALVKEENIDRFLGKMSYQSHENPWTYNVISMIAGWLPWTLLIICSLFELKYRPIYNKIKQKGDTHLKRIQGLWNRFLSLDSITRFSFLAAAVIFIFYCIPKSKRSVYLLPVYPFAAYFMARYILHLCQAGFRSIRIFGHIIAGLIITLFAVFLAVRFDWVPTSLFGGKHADENIAFMHALRDVSGWWAIVGFLPLPMVVLWFRQRQFRHILGMLVLLFVSLDTFYQPVVLNVKSDKQIAAEVQQLVPEGPIESYVSKRMLHFFTINFYNHNRVGIFEGDKQQGYLLIGDKDSEAFFETYAEQFSFTRLYISQKRSCDTKQRVCLYEYSLR